MLLYYCAIITSKLHYATLSLFGEQGESNLHRVFNENGVDIASISEHLKKHVGGTLDFIHSDPKDEEEISDDSEVKHIRSEIEALDCNVAEIRRLESSIKLISGDLNTKAE